MTTLPSFAACPRKRLARAKILTEWRRLSGLAAIQPQRHYVTLNGPLVPGSEVFDLSESGLFRPEQVCSVENRLDVHAHNVAAAQAMGTPVRLLFGDISDVVSEGIADGSLRPQVVNADLMVGPKEGAHILQRILSAVSTLPGPSMVVWNVLLREPHGGKRFDVELLDVVMMALQDGDWVLAAHGEYDGTGPRSRTVMGTVIFYRKASI